MKQILTLTAATLFSASVFAGTADTNNDVQPPPRSLSNGFYIEPYFGYSHVAALDNASRKNGLSGGAALGYKLTENWAVDTGYTQLTKANVSTHYGYFSLKYIFPIQSSWDVFGKMGPAYARGQRDRAIGAESNVVLYAGLGGTYWFTSNVGIVLQSAITTRDNNTPFTFNLTAGLDYFF